MHRSELPLLHFNRELHPQLIEHRAIFKGGGVAAHLLAIGQSPQNPAHDLAAAGFRQGIAELDQIRPGDRADLLAHMAAQLRHQGVVAVAAGLQGHEGSDGLPLELIWPVHHSRFRHSRVAHQGALDLHGAQPVAAHLDHVVDAAHHPEIAIGVAADAIAGEIEPGAIGRADLLPVALAEALRIAVHRAHHSRPGAPHRRIATRIGRLRNAFMVDHIGHDPRQGQGAVAFRVGCRMLCRLQYSIPSSDI